MKYLLDTHTLLWFRLEPNKLKKAHLDIISDSDSQKVISTVSIWEISLKFALGKLDLGGHTPEKFFETAADLGFQIVAPPPKHLASFYRLEQIPDHKDPFDRMLIRQAIQANMVLLSSDRKFHQYKPVGLTLA